ncbi:hypothetical protein RJ640_013702 [Escallonia rubra]|uniref:Uncharacterized protein n=1 Tax=Escallonia rubra TaxID=112253 RepID=A0AA88U925_9ASTE|nr:hypothetical protein RJ640_013702 [Escallonia rubra]
MAMTHNLNQSVSITPFKRFSLTAFPPLSVIKSPSDSPFFGTKLSSTHTRRQNALQMRTQRSQLPPSVATRPVKPLSPLGLECSSSDRFEEGADQFRIDVAQNPNDTEESIWCFLCEAQLYGADEARRRFLEVGRDPRPVMREAYNMFKDGGDPEKLVTAFSSGRENECFYASLYAGLYYESQNEPEGAKRHIISACQSPYGLRSEDYMASLAKVHSQCRSWSSS